MLAHPPYKVQRGRDEEKSEHDWLSAGQAKVMVRLCEAIMKPGKRGHLFCTVQQSVKWYEVLSKEYEEEKSVHDSGSKVI